MHRNKQHLYSITSSAREQRRRHGETERFRDWSSATEA
jgi:hypothetical protein